MKNESDFKISPELEHFIVQRLDIFNRKFRILYGIWMVGMYVLIGICFCKIFGWIDF